MKRTELRIGNLVEGNGKIHEVSSIYADDIIRLFNKDKIASIGCFSLKVINPIPITEEWLFKLGLDYTSEKDYYYITFTIKGLFFQSSTSPDGFVYDRLLETAVFIKYVHQLQNLYFALTGEELTIKN
jgi:hypothetical protein